MPNPEVLPSWPAGHIILDTEAATMWALLQASATDGGLWPEQMFYRSASQTFASSTTLTPDNVFSVPVVANATYILDGYFPYTSNATALFKGVWTLPAAASGTWDPVGPPGTVTTGNNSPLFDQAFSLTTTLTFGYGSSTCAFHVKGSVTTGATAGNVVWTFAQSVITAVQTGMVAGAWLTARRVL